MSKAAKLQKMLADQANQEEAEARNKLDCQWQETHMGCSMACAEGDLEAAVQHAHNLEKLLRKQQRGMSTGGSSSYFDTYGAQRELQVRNELLRASQSSANRTVVQSLKTYIGLAKEEWSRDDGGASDMCTLRGHVSVTLRDVGNEEELDIGAAAKEVGGEERNLSVAFALAKAKAKKCACPIAEHNASAPPTRRVLRGMRLSHLNGKKCSDVGAQTVICGVNDRSKRKETTLTFAPACPPLNLSTLLPLLCPPPLGVASVGRDLSVKDGDLGEVGSGLRMYAEFAKKEQEVNLHRLQTLVLSRKKRGVGKTESGGEEQDGEKDSASRVDHQCTENMYSQVCDSLGFKFLPKDSAQEETNAQDDEVAIQCSTDANHSSQSQASNIDTDIGHAGRAQFAALLLDVSLHATALADVVSEVQKKLSESRKYT